MGPASARRPCHYCAFPRVAQACGHWRSLCRCPQPRPTPTHPGLAPLKERTKWRRVGGFSEEAPPGAPIPDSGLWPWGFAVPIPPGSSAKSLARSAPRYALSVCTREAGDPHSRAIWEEGRTGVTGAAERSPSHPSASAHRLPSTHPNP